MLHWVSLVLSVLLATADPVGPLRPPVQSNWYTTDRLGHSLRAKELGKLQDGPVGDVFFGKGDPRKALKALFENPKKTRPQLRALAGSITLVPRKAKKGVQPNSRIALIWWDTKADKVRRSTSLKDNTFHPKTDRLLAVLAVLDNKAIRRGKWRPWAKRPKLPVPKGWIPKKRRPNDRYHRRQAVGLALAALSSISQGDFAGEQHRWLASQQGVDDDIACWLMRKHKATKAYVNERDRVVVLAVYQYPKSTGRICSKYRFYAVSASGKLEVQSGGAVSPNGTVSMSVGPEHFGDN